MGYISTTRSDNREQQSGSYLHSKIFNWVPSFVATTLVLLGSHLWATP